MLESGRQWRGDGSVAMADHTAAVTATPARFRPMARQVTRPPARQTRESTRCNEQSTVTDGCG